MILTVTPNAAVDKTYQVEDFTLDRVHRPAQAFTVAGGKGINVARVFQTLGGTALTTGYLAGMHGKIVRNALRDERIAESFVTVRGESRLCIAVVDPRNGTQTEVNELGPDISRRNLFALHRKIENLLSQQPFDCVILSGSLPPGVPEEFYATLIDLANYRGIRAVLDTSGNAAHIGVEAKPWMVKPNIVELEAIFRRPIESEDDLLHCVEILHAKGIGIVAVTRGAKGAYLRSANGLWEATPPTIEFASAVASGDSFLAAFLYQWLHGSPQAEETESLRLAIGAGAANAAVIGAGFCTKESIYQYAGQALLSKRF